MERCCLSVWLACALVFSGWIQNAGAAETTRVSVSTAGVESDVASNNAVISGSGRYVVFESEASNLVAGLDAFTHIFLRDLATDTTIVVDSGANGLSDSAAFGPAISGDGRFVAFGSGGTNLGPDLSTSSSGQVFVYEIQSGSFFIASVNDSGELADVGGGEPAISETGRYIAFTSNAGNLVDDEGGFPFDVYLHDSLSGTTERVSIDTAGTRANADSRAPSISSDGRFVAFRSQATNLVAGDTNDAEDVFLRDRVAGTTTRVSIGPGGVEHNGSFNLGSDPKVSADGRFITYDSDADNLVANDTNMTADVFIYDIAAGTNSLASLTNSGQQFDTFVESTSPTISRDGRFVAFINILGLYIRDRETGSTAQLLPQANGTEEPGVSDSGQLVVFTSANPELVANDTNGVRDVFVHDLQTAPPSSVSVVASVLPTSRSVQVGDTASAFATIINTGSDDGIACAPGLPLGTSIPFSFQATDAATNAPVGTANTPIDIAAGQAQSFVFSLTPTVALSPTDLALEFSCANGDPASTIIGVNTFLFSASAQPVGDVIVLAATLGAIPGVVDLAGVSGAGAFAIATFNVGAADTFTVAPRPSAGLAVTLSICQTNPADGSCMQPPSTEVVTAIANSDTPTFAVFATGTGVDVPLDAANNRVAVDFTDSGDAIRGGSSVAIRTN